MPFTTKDWRDSPGDLTTPITAVALEDLETRTTAYAQDVLPFVSFKRFSNLAFNGVTDVGPAINAALISLRDAGGGTLVLPGGYGTAAGLISQPIILQNLTGIAGQGMHQSGLVLANGVNADMVQNYVSSNGIEANAEFCSVRDLTLDGNKANQTSGAGIYFTSEPAFSQAPGDEDFDTHQDVRNVEIRYCKEDGLAMSNRSESRFINVYVQYCDGNGFQPSFDTYLDCCSAAQCGLAGFKLTAPTNHLTNCNAFYNGQLTAAAGHGYHLTSGGAMLSACEAQDNKAHGFLLAGTDRGSVLSACQADSNSTAGVGTYAGFHLNNSHDNRLSACQAYERRANGTTDFQTHALQLSGGSARNDIGLHHFSLSPAVVTDAIVSGSGVAGNRICINNEEGLQTPTFSATLTPNPYLGGTIVQTLTGNLTIAAPAAANIHTGTRLTFVLTQDGTGSRTGTWNATYRRAGGALTLTTTPAKTDIVSFLYNGTNWVETARALNT